MARDDDAFPRRVLDAAGAVLDTPALLVDAAAGVARAAALTHALGAVSLRYAVKAGPYPSLLRALFADGHGAEVASLEEARLVVAAGVDAGRLLCSNPMVPQAQLAGLAALGVRCFVVDSTGAVERLAGVVPGADVLVRFATPSPLATYNLSAKFGADIDEVVPLLESARARGLCPRGLAFHVGSQTGDAAAWHTALAAAGAVLERCERAGVPLRTLDVGGGFPAAYGNSHVQAGMWQEIGAALAAAPFLSLELWCEPGRLLAAHAGWMVATVIGVADRRGQRIAHVDTGVYHGMLEAAPFCGGFSYPLRALELDDEPSAAFQLVGPTCDSTDVFAGEYALPRELRAGHRIVFGLAGAYSVTCATAFNGFRPPHVVEIS